MPDLTPYPVLNYALCGLIGSALYILSAKLLWDQDPKWYIAAIRRLIAGPIIGVVIYILNIPDSLTAITAGYVGIDWIEGILNKSGPSKPSSTGLTWITLLGVIAGAIIAAGGLLILLIDFPTGLTDLVGWGVLIVGLLIALVSGYAGKPTEKSK